MGSKIKPVLISTSPEVQACKKGKVGTYFLNIGHLYDVRLMIDINSEKGKAVVL
jgi:hypothetical protein